MIDYTRDQFVRDLQRCATSQVQFATRLGLTTGTVNHWGTGRNAFPSWVPLLLAAWIDNQRLAMVLQELRGNRTTAP